MGRLEQRSDKASEYRRLYGTARWIRLRERQLSDHPLCQWCLELEIVEPATVIHHGDGGHKGDVDKFWKGPFVSVCKPCHDTRGKVEDMGKRVVTFGVDGYPID